MTKPFTKLILGGSIKVTSKGDTYKDPSGSEKIYEKSSLKVNMAGMKQPVEITKDIWQEINKVLADPAVKEKLKDWV
jgi:hypothetical protein